MRGRDWRSRPRIGRRSPLRGLLARPEIDVEGRGPAEEVWWARVLEAEWARLFAGDVSGAVSVTRLGRGSEMKRHARKGARG